ncbi:DUF1102 domain-containing protein [Thermococcus sp. 21S7]|uniref:DUF1102 domain-containing protein n=1 Tax=Thermococcus sp. 21S7 TaxID=1638221 RepID=UPI00143A221E|nr:DUF1102 domain-containing protein [Thermococcus sp. 21S7]NJE62013.1 DUF1102 domain-containing protein [Thermococcus sp. 21S7]
MRKKIALGMLGLLVALGLVIGAGANFRDYSASRSVHWDIVTDDNELIDLTPLQPYAYIDNETGVLVVDISPDNPNYPGYGQGLSPNSEYNFDEVFEVSNDLWENMSIVVMITSDNDEIQLYGADGNIHDVRNGDIVQYSDTAVSRVCFVVDSGAAVKVGMDFDAGNHLPGTSQSATLHIQAWRKGTEPDDLVGKCGQ